MPSGHVIDALAGTGSDTSLAVVTPVTVASPRARGLDEAATLDIILPGAIFGWANRLMHTLGEPVAEGT